MHHITVIGTQKGEMLVGRYCGEWIMKEYVTRDETNMDASK